MHHAGPNEIIGPQNVKRARHLVRVQIPLVPHHVFKIADLAFADEKTELPGVGEIVLRSKQCHRCQSVIAVAPHGRRGNRQQRTAETVTGRVDLAVRNDLGHSIKCRHDAQPLVIVHAQIPILWARVFPRQDEHGVASTHEVFDQRPSRRKIEDIVLHDPCRHDQDWLRKDFLGGRKVLDQFNQAVLVDHLPWSGCNVFAGLVLFCPERRLAQIRTLPVVERILNPLPPPCSKVTRVISGFVHGKLDGETMSSSCRVTNETTAWLRLESPSISVVALCHHCSFKRNDW